MSTPTPETDFAFSYEYGVDIDLTPDAVAPTYQRVRFPSAIDPQVTPTTKDGATYDNLGSPNQVKLSESWTLGFSVQAQRIPETGLYLPEVEALLAATRPDAVGTKATRRFRWYDKPAVGAPNPNEAYEGRGTVTVSRGQTGNDEIGSFNVTVTGQGRRTQIPNPQLALAIPTVSAATPAAAAAGAQVTLTGTGFLGTTSIKFGTVTAPVFTVVSPNQIVVTVPAGTAGSTPIIIANGTGASTPFPYTRGA